MQPEEYRRMAELQERHWWFDAKRRVVRAALARIAGPPAAAETRTSGPDDGPGPGHESGSGGAGERAAARDGGGASETDADRGDVRPWALEVGCGTGAMLPVIRERGRPLGVDAYLPGLRHVRGAATVGGDLLGLPVAGRSVALVGCFDVLYHQRVGDVVEALREIHRVLAPGGLLVITDSAFPSLRSAHDVATHGARRFRLRPFCRRLEAAGFDVLHQTYFHTFLFPAAAVVRWTKRLLHGAPRLDGAGEAEAARAGAAETALEDDSAAGPGRGAERLGTTPGKPHPAPGPDRSAPRSDLAAVPGWLNGLLAALYRLEAPLAARARMPFGVSLLVVARRR